MMEFYNIFQNQGTKNSKYSEYIIIINQMEQSKNTKSLAYARFPKANQKAKCPPPPETDSKKKNQRNSTGNIYQQLIGEMNPGQNKYIRELVSKNSKDSEPKSTIEANHERAKSYADIHVESSKVQQNLKKNQHKVSQDRKKRDTLIKTKNSFENFLSCQQTPKNNEFKEQTFKKKDCSDTFDFNFSNSLAKSDKIKFQKTMLSSLDNYIGMLNDIEQSSNGFDQDKDKSSMLNHTMKISSNGNFHHTQDPYIAKIESLTTKTKQLKNKNSQLERQHVKYFKKQNRMKENMYKMLDEIRFLNEELTKEKKERRKLEKVIENFEVNIRRCIPERKTIGAGKAYEFRNQNIHPKQFHSELMRFEITENDSELCDIEEEFQKCNQTSKLKNKPRERQEKRHLDEENIESMFRSKCHSNDSSRSD